MIKNKNENIILLYFDRNLSFQIILSLFSYHRSYISITYGNTLVGYNKMLKKLKIRIH